LLNEPVVPGSRETSNDDDGARSLRERQRASTVFGPPSWACGNGSMAGEDGGGVRATYSWEISPAGRSVAFRSFGFAALSMD